MSLSDDIRSINAEIEKLRRDLGKKPLKPFEEKDLEYAKESLAGLRAELRDMGSDLDYISKSFKDSVNELSRQNTYLSDARKALTSIADISRQVTNYRSGDNSLTEKQLEKLQKQAKLKFDELNTILKIGNLSRQNRDEIEAALEEEKNFNKALEQTRSATKEVNRELGLSGGALEGMGKLLEKMGFANISKPISEAIQKTKDARIQYKLNANAVEDLTSKISSQNSRGLTDAQLRAGFGGIHLKNLVLQKQALEAQNKELESQTNKYKNILKAIKDQLTYANLIDMAFTQLVEAILITDKGAGELAKTMNMTYSEALNTRRELGNMAAMSGDAALNTKNLQESYVAIGKSLGSNAMASEATLKTFTKLREQAGYTNEQLAELNKLSLVNGKSLEDNTKEILGGAQAYASRRGLVINEKEILNDVVNASASLKLSLGGSADALAKAAVQTRAVGINLETAAHMADQLLQFESSIENELSAELLVGKDLNFERARQLALNNDIAGAAEEIAKQVGTSADFAEMNAIQQEAIAKAAGMTKDQLAQSLMDREALAALSGVEGANAQEKYNTLRKTMTAEQAAAKLGNEQLAKQYEQQSVQERFTQAVEKLKELFIQIAEPILAIVSPLANLVSTVLPAVNILLQPIVGAFKFIGDIISTALTGAGKLLGIFTGTTKELGFWESILGSLVIAFGTITAYSKMSAAYAAFRAAAENTTVGALAKQGLQMVKNLGIAIAEAVAKITGASAATLGIAAAIALAAGATAYAFLSSKKGDDVFSAGTGGGGGYGQRMLYDKGSIIALNDSDNVIATTNPIKPVTKANDMYSQGTVTVANSTAPKPEPAPAPAYDGSNVVKALKDGFSKSVQVSRVS